MQIHHHQGLFLALFFFATPPKNSDRMLGVSVGGVEAERSRAQSPNPGACRLSPLFLFSFSTTGCFCSLSLSLAFSLSLSISGPPSGGVVVVCLVFSSYRLHRLPPSASAAPRLLHRLQRCCSGSSSRSITRAASSVLSASLRGQRMHSTFFPPGLFCYTAYCRCKRMKCCNGG